MTEKNHLQKVLSSKTLKSYKDKKLNSANFGDFSHSDWPRWSERVIPAMWCCILYIS
jgi:hypothetical protein